MTKVAPTIYPTETAGKLMVPKDRIPTVFAGTTLTEVKELLTSRIQDFVSINYIYVVNKDTHLQGVFSIKEFFEHQKDRSQVENIMQSEIVSVKAHTHQERAALQALQHNLKELPVIDKDGVFLGIIPSDEILKILDKEAVEDILRFGGIYHKGSFDDLTRLSPIQSIKHHLPWLMIGMFGGFLAAGIIGGFEETLSKNLILAAFIPLVVYMADAVGTQMQTFIIRDLAINPTLKFLKYFLKQISIVSLIGLIVSASLILISFVLYQNWRISFVLGIALFLAILTTLFSGLVVPYLFGKLKFDPANASGPIATIIQDVLSVSVYFFYCVIAVVSRILPRKNFAGK